MHNTFYITTSIPYANSSPHLGNTLDFIYADVLARYQRQHGADTRFLTGTDEHGVKIVRSAEAAGLKPQEFIDKNSVKFRELKKVLNLSWDDFIRTSDKERHWPGAVKVWKALEAAGDLYKKTYKGLYCVGHEAFITDKDLSDGICRDHQKKPEVIEEENWFFRLSKYSGEIESRIKSNALPAGRQELRVVPETRQHEILALMKEGLEDISFSRPSKDLSWGVPVPGDSTQTMYVWADALTNYISALGYGSGDEALFKKYWPADVQVIGKDNLRFHAAIWPGMLLAAGLPLPKTIFVHGFLTVGGQKISKTVGNVIDPVELVGKYGTDPVRYYLLQEISPFEDGDFSYEKFEECYNSKLANGLGNFTARVLALGEKLGEIKVDLKKDVAKETAAEIEKAKKTVEEKLDGFRFHEAIAAVWELIGYGDAYINNEKPWDEAVPGARRQAAIVNVIVILDNVAALLAPFLPETAEKITKCVSWPSENTLQVKKSANLFPRI